MADNDVKLKDYSDTPASFFPRTKDRGNSIRENVNGVSDVGGAQINPATSDNQATLNASVASLNTATGTTADAASASGASTTIIGALRAIRDKLFGSVAVTGTFFQATQPVSGTFWQATQPVSNASLPLPTGASTSALQTSGNSSLTSLDGKTPSLTRSTIVEGTAAITVASTASTANGTITNANAVTIMAANASVRRRRVQNLGTATIYVRFNNFADTTVAYIPAASGAGSVQSKMVIALAAGATWETPVDEDATGLVSVCSATANQTVAFSAS